MEQIEPNKESINRAIYFMRTCLEGVAGLDQIIEDFQAELDGIRLTENNLALMAALMIRKNQDDREKETDFMSLRNSLSIIIKGEVPELILKKED